jgi:hypothetical protein
MIAKIALRRINKLAVPHSFSNGTPYVFRQRNSQTIEKKACSKCGENFQNTLFRVFQPLVKDSRNSLAWRVVLRRHRQRRSASAVRSEQAIRKVIR